MKQIVVTGLLLFATASLLRGEEPLQRYPYAEPVPSKLGYLFSPYVQKGLSMGEWPDPKGWTGYKCSSAGWLIG